MRSAHKPKQRLNRSAAICITSIKRRIPAWTSAVGVEFNPAMRFWGNESYGGLAYIYYSSEYRASSTSYLLVLTPKVSIRGVRVGQARCCEG